MQNRRPVAEQGAGYPAGMSRSRSLKSIHAPAKRMEVALSPGPRGLSCGMARLSVNLNKIALLRNSRRTGVPDLRKFARVALESGARGLTVHPRPDERHIRSADVPMLAELMRPVRPAVEFNIEGYPDERFMQILRDTRPEQVTLVPDAPDAFTSEEGWKLDAAQAVPAAAAIAAIKALGSRVILFIDPDPTGDRPSAADGRRRSRDLHRNLCRGVSRGDASANPGENS